MIGPSGSSYRYANTAKNQTALKMRNRDVAATCVRYGYRHVHALLRREDWRINPAE